MMKDFVTNIYIPKLLSLLSVLDEKSRLWKTIPFLSRTHGQPASPTTFGKEIMVFVSRLKQQLVLLTQIPFSGKFGGAVGNLNSLYVVFKDRDWHSIFDDFLESLGLIRQQHTTQIEHYDNMAGLFHCLARINTILIDFCRDIWTYTSLELFNQEVKAGEVGSSAMPHKVNPIDFENAEGNFGLANALFEFLARKLPI